MGKNKKPAAIPEAAPAAKPENEATAIVKKLDVSKVDMKNYSGMSIDSTVTALERIGKMIYDNPRAKEQFKLTDEQVGNLNEFVLSGMTTALVVDIVAKKSTWSVTMNKTQLESVNRVLEYMNVQMDVKALPAPDENGNVEVTLDANTVKVNKETEEAIKKEVEIAEAAIELDPTKFQNEEDLALALDHIIVSEKGAFAKFTRTAALLKAYRTIQAGEDEEAKKKINAMTQGELLNEVFRILYNSKIVTHMPLVLNGFGGYIYRETSQAMSPVLGFCKLRDASKNSAGVPSVDNETLVGIQRTLVEYCANNNIAKEQAKIEDHKKNLTALLKDKKKNAEGIKDVEGKISICEKNIEHFNDVIAVVHEPESEFANDFIEDYNNPESEGYRRARQVFKYITSSFYGEELTKIANQDHLKKNVQQYIGIITNMFRPAANQFDQFSESRLIEISPLGDNEGKGKN